MQHSMRDDDPPPLQRATPLLPREEVAAILAAMRCPRCSGPTATDVPMTPSPQVEVSGFTPGMKLRLAPASQAPLPSHGPCGVTAQPAAAAHPTTDAPMPPAPERSATPPAFTEMQAVATPHAAEGDAGTVAPAQRGKRGRTDPEEEDAAGSAAHKRQASWAEGTALAPAEQRQFWPACGGGHQSVPEECPAPVATAALSREMALGAADHVDPGAVAPQSQACNAPALKSAAPAAAAAPPVDPAAAAEALDPASQAMDYMNQPEEDILSANSLLGLLQPTYTPLSDDMLVRPLSM